MHLYNIFTVNITTAYLLCVPGFGGDGGDVVHEQVCPGQDTQQRCAIKQRPHFIQPADHLHKTLFRKECDKQDATICPWIVKGTLNLLFKDFCPRCLLPIVWWRWRWLEEGWDPACAGPWQAETTAACQMSGSKKSPSSCPQWEAPGAGAAQERSAVHRWQRIRMQES